jgi:predicted metal-dependent hydrolase
MVSNDYDAGYLGYFECFNAERYFEAHEVLEALWLPQRQEANGLFYKGLIQLAGAFVHWQKRRRGPAMALFNLARANLQKYPSHHERLNVSSVLALIDQWLRVLVAAAPAACPPLPRPTPTLHLETGPRQQHTLSI